MRWFWTLSRARSSFLLSLVLGLAEWVERKHCYFCVLYTLELFSWKCSWLSVIHLNGRGTDMGNVKTLALLRCHQAGSVIWALPSHIHPEPIWPLPGSTAWPWTPAETVWMCLIGLNFRVVPCRSLQPTRSWYAFALDCVWDSPCSRYSTRRRGMVHLALWLATYNKQTNKQINK
jgi:hypothetical protein